MTDEGKCPPEQVFGNPQISVHKVEINGVKFTKSHIFESQLKGLLQAGSLMDIFQAADEGARQLAALNVFKRIDVRVENVDGDDDSSSLYQTGFDGSTAAGDDESPIGNPLRHLFGGSAGIKQKHSSDRRKKTLTTPKQVNIIIDVVERPRLQLKTGTEIGANEGSVSASFTLKNRFGYAEIIEGSMSKSNITNSCYQLRYAQPLNGNVNKILSFLAYQKDENWQATSSHSLMSKVFISQLAFRSRFGVHEISHNLVHRSMFDLLPLASLHIREYADKDHLKTSLRHVYTKDSRNPLNPFLTDSGSLFRLSTELGTCLPALEPFLKNELETTVYHELPHKFIFSSTIRAGLLHYLFPATSSTRQTPFYDRFYLGGPLSIRGFETRGMGPKAIYPSPIPDSTYNQDSLGGDAYWSLGMSMLMPVPFFSDYDSVKMHAFYNTGSLFKLHAFSNNIGASSVADQLNQIIPIGNMWKSALTSPISSTVGFGVCIRSAMCRLEANYVHPLSAAASDKLAGKVQLGIGLEFM